MHTVERTDITDSTSQGNHNPAITDLIHRFTPVSLDELNESASLLTRVERKYILRTSSLVQVLRRIEPLVKVLDMNGNRQTGYESVYFDTPDFESYLDAAHSRRRRFKVRSRSYLETETTYLEVKTKGQRNQTAKERLSYDFSDRYSLTDQARSYVADVMRGDGITRVDAQMLAPACVTKYARTTLLQSAGANSEAARATIDLGLTWLEPDNHEPALELPEIAIVETKSGTTVSPVDKALWWEGFRPITMSKFCTGMATMHLDLPRNKWHRILTSLAPESPSTAHSTPRITQ